MSNETTVCAPIWHTRLPDFMLRRAFPPRSTRPPFWRPDTERNSSTDVSMTYL
jgi:hypothetical protein